MGLNRIVGVAWMCCTSLVIYNIIELAERTAHDISPSLDGPQDLARTSEHCFTISNSTFQGISQRKEEKRCVPVGPEVHRARNKRQTRATRLCVIGETERFTSINNFLRNNPSIPPTWLQFHSFGSSGPRSKVPYWTPHPSNYTLAEIFDECDGMVGVEVQDSELPGGLVQAVTYSRPILLTPEDSMIYQADARATKVFADESFDTSMKMLIEHVEPGFFVRKPDCEVLIDNHLVDYHYFLLESFMALYPLPELESCNHNHMYFTFLINRSNQPFQRNRAQSWKEYALTAMKDKYQKDRYVKAVILGIFPNTRAMKFDYEIKASCYCADDDIAWLRNSSNAYCVFHESCDEYSNSPHALWLSPHHKQYVLPTLLPEFKHPRPVNDTVNFCVIGHPKRRNYNLVAHFLKTRKPQDVHFHNLGWGPQPEDMNEFEHLFTRYDESAFVSFERIVYDLCDVVLALIARETQPDYFSGPKKKQSGSMLQAIAYQRPMVLHEDLAEPYRAQLAHIETHNDDAESFALAMDRMLKRKRSEKRSGIQ